MEENKEENRQEDKEINKGENKEEIKEVNKEEKSKINFFKKIWYSIGKVSKYNEMMELGSKKAIKYFFSLIAILSLILSIVVVILMVLTGIDAETLEQLQDIGMSENQYYIYSAIIYYLSHFIVLFLIYGIYILIISASIFLVSKLFKIKESFKEALSSTIYAATLSIILYVIYLSISYFTGFVIPYFDSIAIMIVFIYIAIIFYKKRKENGNVIYRRGKAKSKK